MGGEDKQLERVLAKTGCEVHCFDPSIREAHLQDSNMWLHRLSIDWRDPNPAIMTQRQHSSNKKLSTVLNHYGHRQVMQNAVTCAEHRGDNIVNGYDITDSFKIGIQSVLAHPFISDLIHQCIHLKFH